MSTANHTSSTNTYIIPRIPPKSQHCTHISIHTRHQTPNTHHTRINRNTPHMATAYGMHHTINGNHKTSNTSHITQTTIHTPSTTTTHCKPPHQLSHIKHTAYIIPRHIIQRTTHNAHDVTYSAGLQHINNNTHATHNTQHRIHNT